MLRTAAIALVLAAALVAAGLAMRHPPRAHAVAESEPAPSPPPPQRGPRIHYPPGYRSAQVLAPAGRETISSVLNVTRPMRYGEYVWNDDRVPPGKVWARVDLKRQIVSVFRSGHEIGTAVILYGSDGTPTPLGTFPIMEKRADYRSRKYDAPMPYMMRLTPDGVALHASDVRYGAVTHGCVGLPLPFARLIFGQLGVGDPVVVEGVAPTAGA